MKSIFSIYIVWSVILVLHGSWVVFTSKIEESTSHEFFQYFVISYYMGFVLFYVPGGFIAWFTQKGKLWALWLFTVFCIYKSYSYIWGIIRMSNREETVVDSYKWVIAIAIAAIWLLLASYAWQFRLKNKFQSPIESGG